MTKFIYALVGSAAFFTVATTPVLAQQGADPDNAQNELGEGSREAVENPGDVSIRDQRPPMDGAGSVQIFEGNPGVEGATARSELGEGNRESVESSPGSVSQRDQDQPLTGAGSRQAARGSNTPGGAVDDNANEDLGESNEESVEGPESDELE